MIEIFEEFKVVKVGKMFVRFVEKCVLLSVLELERYNKLCILF